MVKTAIVTDSTADLSGEDCKKNNITVVPLSVLFGEEVFKDDGIELTKEQFYKKLKSEKDLPTTTQPTPSDFKKVYEDLLKDYQDIISIHISKKMSGTIDSAESAKKEISSSGIEIVDSEMTTIPLGLLVLEASKLARQGKSRQEILDSINEIKSKTKTYFVPKTLEYLQKGGRIGRAKGLIASLLEIKPILCLYKGEVAQFKNTRRWNQAKKEMIDTVKKDVRDAKNLIFAVADADLKEEGDMIAEKVKDIFSPKFLWRTTIGCIVGTHLGPAVAIAFYEE